MAPGVRSHVLVVDDEPCVREALTAALHPPYIVHPTASGAEALAQLQLYPIAATDSLTGTISRAYDALNRPVSEVTAQGAITYAYDQISRRFQMQANGLQAVAYGYDPASRLAGITQGTQTVSLVYDPSNRRTSLVLPNSIVITYTYDDASRLVAQTYTGPSRMLGDLTYSYDVNGDRIGTGGSWARSLLPATVASPTYDPSNEQLAFGEVAQTFDANGNLLTQTDATGTTTYTWDARNRLTAVSGPTVSASFAYDALGRRISKTINGQTSAFHYDGVDIIRESGSVGDAAYLRILAIDETLSRTGVTGTLAYLSDILGSTLALADTSGSLPTTYTYAPFGDTTISGASANPFQFTGRENEGTGLYYYRARYYDPVRSRFISEDPIRLAGGTKVYAYVRNSPTQFRDPRGLIEWPYDAPTPWNENPNWPGPPDRSCAECDWTALWNCLNRLPSWPALVSCVRCIMGGFEIWGPDCGPCMATLILTKSECFSKHCREGKRDACGVCK